VLPVLLLVAFGVVGTGRLVQAQLGISAVAREAAREAALATEQADAAARGVTHGQSVAAGYGLTNGSLHLDVEPGAFTRGDQVRAAARYDVALADLPLLGWARVMVRGEHVERLDLYRSRWPRGEAP
jgi:hypothetical protein